MNTKSWLLICLLFVWSLAGLPGGAAAAEKPSGPAELVEKARISYESMSQDQNFSWIEENWHKVQAVFIVPQFIKGAFIVGGAGGSGVLCVRDAESGTWSYPAFYTLGSASVGLQIGGSVSEVVLMALSQKGVNAFYQSSFKLGAEASVAAGPLGAGLQGATQQNLGADLIAFSRVKGAFIGLSLEGGVVKTRESWNTEYYNQAVQPYGILAEQSVANPHADPLRKSLAGTGP